MVAEDFTSNLPNTTSLDSFSFYLTDRSEIIELSYGIF